VIEQDDGEIWGRIQRGVSGPEGRRRVLRYPAECPPDETWPYPGVCYPGFPTETNQWNYYLRWRELIGSNGQQG
jgi:hypothetical protein